MLSASPDMVQEFHARTQNPRSVMLEWKPPRKPGVMRYKVSACACPLCSILLLLLCQSLSVHSSKVGSRDSSHSSVYGSQSTAPFGAVYCSTSFRINSRQDSFEGCKLHYNHSAQIVEPYETGLSVK